MLDPLTFASPTRTAYARCQLRIYGDMLAQRKRVLQASHREMECALGSLDAKQVDSLDKARAILSNHQRASKTLFEDLHLAQTEVFARLTAATDWLEAQARSQLPSVTDAHLTEAQRKALTPLLIELSQALKSSHDLLVAVLSVQAETLALVDEL